MNQSQPEKCCCDNLESGCILHLTNERKCIVCGKEWGFNEVGNVPSDKDVQTFLENNTPMYTKKQMQEAILKTRTAEQERVAGIVEGMDKVDRGSCPNCGGNGYTVDYDPRDETGNTPMQVQCPACEATGIYEMPNIEYNKALTDITEAIRNKELTD